MVFRPPGRPERTILLWQALFTAAAMLPGAYFAGMHGAISVALGGVVSMASGVLFASVTLNGRADSAGDVLLTAFRAEAAKIVFIVVALWLVLAAYKDVVAIGFIGSFIATVLISTMAFFVRRD